MVYEIFYGKIELLGYNNINFIYLEFEMFFI